MGKTIKNKITILGVVVWLIGALFFLYEFFLRTFLGAVAEQVIPALQLSPSEFAILASVFYLAYGVMQIPVGVLVDFFGVKLAILIAILVCSLSALWFAHVHNYGEALITRFLMGFGGSFAFLCLLIITINWFPKRYLALFVGLGQFIGTMGALCAGGPLASVVSKQHIPWRTVFSSIALFGFFLFIVAAFFMRNKTQERNSAVLYLEKELPLFSKLRQLFVSSEAWWVATYSAFVFLSVAMLGAVWGTTYLQSMGFSQGASATATSFAWLGFALGCPGLGGLSDYLVRRRPVMIGCSIVGLIAVCLTVYFKFDVIWIYYILFFVLGLTSAGQSIGFVIITEHTRPELKSIALGLNSAFITLLAAIVPVVVGLIIEHVAGTGAGSVHLYDHHDFVLGFTIMPLLYLISLIIGLFFITETYCRSKKETIFLQK